LSKDNVQEYIQKLVKKRSDKIEITAENVLKELGKLGFSDIKNLYNNEGKLIPVHQLPSDVSCTIQEINITTIYDKDGKPIEKSKYKTADKKSSLELLGRNLKLFTDKTEHAFSDVELIPPELPPQKDE